MQIAKTAPRNGTWVTKLNSTKLGIYEYCDNRIVGLNAWGIVKGKKLDLSKMKPPVFVQESAREFIQTAQEKIHTGKTKNEETYRIDPDVIFSFLGKGENESMTIKASSLVKGLRNVVNSGQ